MKTCLLFLTILGLFSGCATAPKLDLQVSDPEQQAQIEQRVNQIFDAVAKKDADRLDSYHLYGPKFTKYSSESPNRLETDSARTGEHNLLSRPTGVLMKAEDLKVNVFGPTGIVTFILNYSGTTGTGVIQNKAQSTLVFVNDSGSWKIVHEHFSAAE